RFHRLLEKSKRRCPYNPSIDDGEGSLLILLLSEPSDLTPLGRSVLFCLLTDQVGMASTLSFLVFSFSSSRSFPVPPPREERHRSNDSSESPSVPESSSLGVMTGAEVKVLQALEAGLRFPLHPVIGDCLRWWRVSPGQIAPNSWRYIKTFLGEYFGVEWSAHPISNILPNLSDKEANAVERLKGILSASRAVRNLTEEWLVEALSPASRGMPYMVSISLMRGNPRAGGGGGGGVSSWDCAPDSGSASDVQEIPIEEARGISPHKADRASRGKGPADASVEPPAPRQRPKSVRELCSAQAGVDDRDYHAIRMCNLPEQASDAPLDPDLRPLTHGTPVWQSGEASTTYIRGMVLPRLASDLYTLPSEVLMDGVAKAMVLEGRNPDAVAMAEARAAEAQSIVERLQLELNEANSRRVSAEAELE
ncbi:hypothetical protein BHM03_00051362, partial [Ensete ventricosum]